MIKSLDYVITTQIFFFIYILQILENLSVCSHLDEYQKNLKMKIKFFFCMQVSVGKFQTF